MATLKLTKTVVESLEPSTQEQVVWDEALPGFGLRIKPTGVRSYIVQYRNRHTGASKRMTIGQHGPLLTEPRRVFRRLFGLDSTRPSA
jgi:hypothetical protein